MRIYFNSLTIPQTYVDNIVPKNDIEWLITPDGILKLAWQKKIANYQETDPVVLEITDEDINATEVYQGTAELVQVDHLRLGNFYTLLVIDQASNQKFGPILVSACKSCGKKERNESYDLSFRISDPNCTRGSRMDMECVETSTIAYSFEEVTQFCQSDTPFSMDTTIRVAKRMPRLLENSEFFWLPRPRVSDNQDRVSRIFQDDANSSRSCEAFSPRQNSFRSTPCDQQLPYICQEKLKSKSHLVHQVNKFPNFFRSFSSCPKR